MRFARLTLAAAVAAALASPLFASEDEFRWTGKVAAGRAVEIKGVNGGIEASPASGTEVELVATKRGRRSDPSEVEIKLLEHAGGVTICAVYPSAWLAKPNECAPGEDGRMNTRNNDVEVEFSVRVPAGVRFVGRTVNGGVSVTGLDADVQAYTVNGGVRAESRGHVRAETVNGSISAALGRADWSGDLAFKTVNGGITVELPDGAGALVHAETVNGGIETDFPLTVKGKFSSRRLDGTIGSGGRQLALETVNGSIRLRKRS